MINEVEIVYCFITGGKGMFKQPIPRYELVERIGARFQEAIDSSGEIQSDSPTSPSMKFQISNGFKTTRDISKFATTLLEIPIHPKLLLALEQLYPSDYDKQLFHGRGYYPIWSQFLYSSADANFPLNSKLMKSIAQSSDIPSFSLLINDGLKDLESEQIVSTLKKCYSLQEFFIYLKIDKNFDIEAAEKMVPIQDCQDQWENYVVRRKNWGEDMYHSDSESQILYGKMMHQSVKMAIEIKTEYKLDFGQLLFYLAYRRSQIATAMKHDSDERFGRPVLVFNYTLCGKQYKELGDWFNQLREGDEAVEGYKKDRVKYIERIPKGLIGRECESIIAKIGEKELTIAQIVIDEEVNSVVIIHSDYKNQPIIFEHAKKLYQSAMEESDNDRVFELMGEVFWWLCQGKFWERGDPSIAELLVRTVFDLKNIPLKPWKKEVIPWCEVMKEFDVKKFGRNFKSLFE